MLFLSLTLTSELIKSRRPDTNPLANRLCSKLDKSHTIGFDFSKITFIGPVDVSSFCSLALKFRTFFFHRSGNTRLTLLLFLIAVIHKEYYGIGNLVRRYVITTILVPWGIGTLSHHRKVGGLLRRFDWKQQSRTVKRKKRTEKIKWNL